MKKYIESECLCYYHHSNEKLKNLIEIFILIFESDEFSINFHMSLNIIITNVLVIFFEELCWTDMKLYRSLRKKNQSEEQLTISSKNLPKKSIARKPIN